MVNVIPVGGPGGPPIILPDKFTELRPHQEQAILEAHARFNEGYKVVMLDAPTGAGKTIIGEAVRQLQAGPSSRGLYLCTTLTLQDQFMEDFPDANLIKGRSNYATLDDPMRFLATGLRHLNASHCDKRKVEVKSVPICTICEEHDPDDSIDSTSVEKAPQIMHCSFCHPWQSCPYESAKRQALAGPLTVANTSYFLAEANYVGLFGQRRDTNKPHFPITVIDEADTLESVLMGFVDLEVTPRMVKKLGLRVPDKVTKADSWVEWCDYAHKHLGSKIGYVESQLQHDRTNTKMKDDLATFTRYRQKTRTIRDKITADPDNWVFDGHRSGGIKFRAIHVGPYAEEFLWRHSNRFLLMSATLISASQMAEDLGLAPNDFATVRVDSQFPADRRRIHVMPRASMTAKTKETEWPKMADAVEEVVNLYPADRILVHTVSYDLTRYLQGELSKRLDRPVKYYLSAKERAAALEDFRTSHAAVMLAPSFDRGVDLPDDDVRVIVIAKTPFPYLGDKQVSARFHGTGLAGKSWYATQTVRSLVQMTGRGMRHKDDWCVSFVLDSQFNTNVWRNNRHLIPKWWSDAIHWTRPTR